MAATTQQLDTWLAQVHSAMEQQPDTTWTVARMRLAFPSPSQDRELVAIDTVAAQGNCNAHAVAASVNPESSRIEVEATFSDFELRGTSNLIGHFQILLQEGAEGAGRFQQRHADALYPLHGTWRVPFKIETELGNLIPRPTDPPVLLRSAEPGEFAIPPIGSWFEKWDPIALVGEDAPDGPTLAVVEHAMHVMLTTGPGPDLPALGNDGDGGPRANA